MRVDIKSGNIQNTSELEIYEKPNPNPNPIIAIKM